MTRFIATLSLPYTVVFEPKKNGVPAADKPSQSNQETDDLTRSLANLSTDQDEPKPHRRTNSYGYLLPDHHHAAGVGLRVPQTPGATTDAEMIFTPYQGTQTLKLRLPNSRSSTRLSSLARIDTLSSGWSSSDKFQPQPRVAQPPPSSVLGHDWLTKKSLAAKTPTVPSEPPRLRTVSAEGRFTEQNYTVEPSSAANGALIAAIDAAVQREQIGGKYWVGTLGMPTNSLSEKVKKNIEEKLDLDFESLAVFVDDNDFNSHYEHYCKTILWPHLHYQIPDHPKSKAYLDHSWRYYVTVNQAFADRIVGSWKRGDKIWVHDYHLLLVPNIIRQKLPDAEIGFFLHTAFPSSEIFRCLPNRVDLLKGILGANLVGFQCQEYVSHFLQTCSRVLSVEATKDGILLDGGRFVHVGTYPIGIDPSSIQARCQEPDIKVWIAAISEKYAGKKLVVARDKLDSTRGVRHKLQAYETFLKLFPEFRDNVVLIQIATSAKEDADVEKAVMDVVGRINAEYSSLTHQPLVLLRQDIEHAQWLALLNCAETLMITSLREGMNLTGHEFVTCQDRALCTTKHGPLVLSEFTGAATVLAEGALLVNPWDFKQCARQLKRALEMPARERETKWQKLQEAIHQHDASAWTKETEVALANAYKDHTIRDCASVPRLSQSALKEKYDAATKRLIMIDFEGTLVSCEGDVKDVHAIPQQAINVMLDLIRDNKNTIYVMSSLAAEDLDRVFQRIPGLGLIAEQGAYIREHDKADWTAISKEEQVAVWKDGVKSILNYYVERVEGSYIEELNSTLLFNYKEAKDMDNAVFQATECANHITDICLPLHVHAVPVQDGVRVCDEEINKGTAAEYIYRKMQETAHDPRSTKLDFILAIGDARDDEYVFEWANKMKEQGTDEVVSIAVGQRSTAATCMITQGVTEIDRQFDDRDDLS